MTLKICVAQLNLVVGDLTGNSQKIIQAAHSAYADGARLLLTPELAICGYAAEDLFLRPAFIAACDDALAYRSYYPEATRSKGNAEEQQGKLLAALSLYEATNRLMPALALAWLDRGRVLQKLGRSAEALIALDQAIALNRESAEAWTIRGEAAWTLERYEQAIIAFDKALQVNPNYVPARLLRQKARQTLGR